MAMARLRGGGGSEDSNRPEGQIAAGHTLIAEAARQCELKIGRASCRERV